jgi:hypothetical protein
MSDNAMVYDAFEKTKTFARPTHSAHQASQAMILAESGNPLNAALKHIATRP